MLLARIALAAAVVNAELFNPSKRPFTSVELAQEACAVQGGEIASASDAGLAEFISNDKSLRRKKVLILSLTAGAAPTWVFASNLSKEAKAKKRTPTVCRRSGGVPARNECTASGDSALYPSHYKFYPAQTDETFDHASASAECQKLGPSWDLVIMNNNDEFYWIDDVIQSECWSEQAFWIGFYEFDTPTAGTEGTVETIFGRIPDWKIHWDPDMGDYGEPNDTLGDEKCLRMKNRKVNDALCDRTWTGPRKDGVGMGFVCEKHNFYEACEPKTVDYDPHYSIEFQAALSWQDSRDACMAKGTGWDLAVPNTNKEMDFFVDLVNCDDGGFWLGVQWTPDNGAAEFNSDGSITAVDGSSNPIVRWDKHTNWDKPNPNTKGPTTECIRLRGDLVVDATCTRTSGPDRRPYPQPYGYICEYTEPECTINPNADALVDDEYVIRYDEAINWNGARQECKAIGKHWDLVIFNYDREHERLTQIITDHCLDDFAFWVGYKEYDGTAETVFGQEILAKSDGFTTSIPLPWDVTTNTLSPEPNNWLGNEECVRMRGGETNDALCSRTWTGAKKNGVGMGYICERHNPCEDRRSGTAFSGYSGSDYIVAVPEFISANDAKTACQAHGDGWDLVVIDDLQELKDINDKIDDGCSPFWTGMTENNGIIYDLDRTTEVQFSSWDVHLGYGFNTNPGTPYNSEFDCVRMRGGLYNDADCDDNTGFTKHEKMGYICEYKTPVPTAAPDPDQCLPCKHNPGVLPWTTSRGCAKPNCEAGLGIVDAWKIGNGKDRPVRYGFIGLIKVPKEVIDSGKEFSVLIRFSKRVTHGHFQLWNMKFWNFYNGGYEVLIHSKWWNTDRHDKYSVGFVAEELNAEEYPELLFWTGRQTVHQCFQPSMHHGQTSSQVARGGGGGGMTEYDHAVAEKPEIDPDDITSVKFKNGKIVYVRGNKKYRKPKNNRI